MLLINVRFAFRPRVLAGIYVYKQEELEYSVKEFGEETFQTHGELRTMYARTPILSSL